MKRVAEHSYGFNDNPFSGISTLFGKTRGGTRIQLATPTVTVAVNPDGDSPGLVRIDISPVANAGRYRVTVNGLLVSNANVTAVYWTADKSGKYPVVTRAFPADVKTYKASSPNVQYVTVSGLKAYLVTGGLRRILANMKKILVKGDE